MLRYFFFADVKNIVMLILIEKIQEKIGRGDEVELGERGDGSFGKQGAGSWVICQ